MAVNHMLLVEAVEDLLNDLAGGDYPDSSIIRVKEALGYDPTIKEQDYLVSLSIDISAVTPEEAVKEFISLLESNLDWVYVVKDSEGRSYELDAYDLNRTLDLGNRVFFRP